MAVNRVQRADGTIELDVTGVTAAAEDVAAGKKFVTAAGELADGAMPSVTQATPSISVSSAGLITASATQAAGKVAAGTKSATKQLTVQAAKTWTPGTSDQTIAAERWLSGAQTIKGDANLVAANIVKGKTIFGVAGSAETAVAETVVNGSYTCGSSAQRTIAVSGLTFAKLKYVHLYIANLNTVANQYNYVNALFLYVDQIGVIHYVYGNSVRAYEVTSFSSTNTTSFSYSYSSVYGHFSLTLGSLLSFPPNAVLQYTIIGE